MVICPQTLGHDHKNDKPTQLCFYPEEYSFSQTPFFNLGKCSHGGNADISSTQNPRGGISKDERRAHNTAIHDIAVALAIDATIELLEDIRGAVGNKDYLR